MCVSTVRVLTLPPTVMSSLTTIILSCQYCSIQVTLLKTPVTEVKSYKTSTVANILFDEGAQRFYLLHLTPSQHESITLAPFGADSMTPQSLSVASIKVVAKTGELIPLLVLIVPRIAAPLQTVSCVELNRLPYLHNLTLAHPIAGDKSFEISLLIGVDHYWKLVGDHIIRGDGPTAVQSKLGYLLSGPVHISNCGCEVISTFHVSISPPNVEQTVEKFWTIEFTDDYLSRRQWLLCCQILVEE